jgi:hypothetical protein
MELPVQRDLPVQLAIRGLKAQQDQQVRMELTVQPELPVQLAILDHKV